MLKLFVLVAVVLFFGAKLLPRVGSWLGGQSRKPFRQARWVWSWFAGTEAESLRAEHDYGRECAREFAAQFTGRAPRSMQELVNAVGSRLAEAVKDPRRQFLFTVVPSTSVNAFALPGGFIFITAPLLDLCGQDRDEIAFFLGHEMGHVLRGHAKSQLTASAFLNAVTSRLPGAGTLLHQVLTKGYSREMELEADREGARLAAAAGFDARAAVRALGRLEKSSATDSALAEYFGSHPPLSERIAKLKG